MTDRSAPSPDLAPADIDDADKRAQQIAYLLKGVCRELTGGWNVWCSSTGVLYATRDRRLSDPEMEKGLAMTLHADSPRDLVEKLREQLRIESIQSTRAANPVGF